MLPVRVSVPVPVWANSWALLLPFTAPAKVSYVYRKLPADAGLMEYVCEVDIPALQAFEAQKTDKTPAYNHPF